MFPVAPATAIRMVGMVISPLSVMLPPDTISD
jgi:hypothetical protein